MPEPEQIAEPRPRTATHALSAAAPGIPDDTRVWMAETAETLADEYVVLGEGAVIQYGRMSASFQKDLAMKRPTPSEARSGGEPSGGPARP